MSDGRFDDKITESIKSITEFIKIKCAKCLKNTQTD